MKNNKVSPELVCRLFNLAALLTLTAAWMLVVVALMRSGLGDVVSNQLSVGIFLCLSIWLPVYAISKFKKYWMEAGAIAAIVGTIFPVLGLLLGPMTSYLAGSMIFFIGIQLFITRPKADLLAFWKTLSTSIVLAIVLLSLGSAGRLLLPEEISMGTAHSDAYFHVAIASMIAKFQMPSIGADGLEFTRYHFGSHAVAAGFARASGARVSEVYLYWSVVALRVQVIWAILWCSFHLLSQHLHLPMIRGQVLLIGVFVALANLFFESESFLLACIIFLSVLPLVSRFLAESRKSGGLQWGRFAIIILTVYICTAIKVSVGYFVAALLLYTSFRNLKDAKRLGATFIGLFALAVCALILFLPSDVSLLSAGFGILLASYLQYATLPTLISFLLPFLLLSFQFINVGEVLRLIHMQSDNHEVAVSVKKIYDIPGFFNKIGELKVEWQILFVSLITCILAVITMPIGSNAAYFSGVLLFLSFALIPAGFFRFVHALGQYRLFYTFEFILALVLIVQLLNFGLQYKARAQGLMACEGCRASTNAELKDTSAIEVASTQGLINSLVDYRTLWTTSQARIENSRWSVVIRDIQQFAAAKPSAMVFVPPANIDFWTRLKSGNPYWCITAQLMIPAQIGVPMLRGISPASIEAECVPTGLIWYGYGKNQEVHRTGEFNDGTLCEMTVAKGFGSVYILNSIEHIDKNRKLLCS